MISTRTNKSLGGTQTAAINQSLDNQLEEIYTVLAEGQESANWVAVKELKFLKSVTTMASIVIDMVSAM